MAPDRVEREILINAPIEVVWAVITDPAHVSGWFGETAEIDLRPSGRITHAWKEEGGLTEERGIVERRSRTATRMTRRRSNRRTTSRIAGFVALKLRHARATRPSSNSH